LVLYFFSSDNWLEIVVLGLQKEKENSGKEASLFVWPLVFFFFVDLVFFREWGENVESEIFF